jgi:hypothetical protein
LINVADRQNYDFYDSTMIMIKKCLNLDLQDYRITGCPGSLYASSFLPNVGRPAHHSSFLSGVELRAGQSRNLLGNVITPKKSGTDTIQG